MEPEEYASEEDLYDDVQEFPHDDAVDVPLAEATPGDSELRDSETPTTGATEPEITPVLTDASAEDLLGSSETSEPHTLDATDIDDTLDVNAGTQENLAETALLDTHAENVPEDLSEESVLRTFTPVELDQTQLPTPSDGWPWADLGTLGSPEGGESSEASAQDAYTPRSQLLSELSASDGSDTPQESTDPSVSALARWWSTAS